MIKCQGAEWIYDTDDDNEPLRQSLPLQNQLLQMKINQEGKVKQTTTNIYKQVTQTQCFMNARSSIIVLGDM